MSRDLVLRGLSLTPGVAIGPLWVCKEADTWECDRTYLARDHERREEVRRFQWALNSARAQIMDLQHRAEADKQDEMASILAAHVQLLRDPSLIKRVERGVRKSGWRACFALKATLNEHLKALAERQVQVANPELLSDLRDVSQRLGLLLTEQPSTPWSQCPPGSVVVCREMLPSVFAQAASHNLIGLVSQIGGETSHLAIMARAKEVPFLSKIKFPANHWRNSHFAILDSNRSLVICNPSATTLRGYRSPKMACGSPCLAVSSCAGHTLSDGTRIHIAGNAESAHQIQQLIDGGARAIGLFRSEVLAFKLRCFPSEKLQMEFYRQLIKAAAGSPLTIRLFDIGGDKVLDWSQRANRSALGMRGIRFLLKHRRQLRCQLRALVSLRSHSTLSILIPMVSQVEEVEETRYELERACEQLQIPGEYRPRLGCMLEVPSSALIMDQMAPHADFFSLGTNDLCQYLLARDRNHSQRSPNLSYHPAILKVIKHVIQQGRKLNKPVSICGEMCSDAHLIPVLVGLGMRNFSMSPANLPLMGGYLRGFSLLQAKQLARRVLEMTSVEKIRSSLKSARAEFLSARRVGPPP